MSNVTVNFNVNANAAGTVNIFGQAVSTMSNFLIANVNIPASSFYTDATNALFSFNGFTSNLDGITGVFNSNYSNYTSTLIMSNINSVVNGSMNCSNAAPYNLAKYSNVYNTQSNFGHVALGAYADKLFGHIAATAAIDNDTTFVSNMVGNTLSNASHARIAGLLYSNIASTDPTAIVKQVLGQDASRSCNVDNDGITPNTSNQTLRWIAGDVVFMTVTLNAPTITVANAAQTASNAVTTTAAAFGSNVYPIRITLS
jgi:hypothetical protein